MAKRVVLNEIAYFGWGSRSYLVDELTERKYKKALVVTDAVLLELGIAEKAISLLDNTGISYEVFSDVKPNPTISNVKKGLKIANKNHVDCIIAVGGGSVIDVAKAIGIIATNPEFKDVKSLVGEANTNNRALPIIALPTTAGTAAEVTVNYVITDEEEKVKLVCVDKHDIPVLSIVDSELMAYMPAGTAAATGLDALTHAIECYLTKGAWEMTDMFALQAMNIIYHYLEKSITKDRYAMDKIALAQYIAGMGFSNAGLGIVHSMAHQLGAVYDTPHGVANALLLPYVLDFNGKRYPGKFREMAPEFDIDATDLNDTQVVEEVVKAIKELTLRLNIPEHISDIGGKKEDIPMLAEKALNDPCTPGNPVTMKLEDFIELFERAF